MEHQVPHDLGRERAKTVTVAALDSYAKKFAEYKPQSTWNGDYDAQIQFSVKGMTLKGKVAVKETSIGLELDVPFMLRPFKGKAISVIEREIQEWIKKAKAGEI